MTEAEFEQAAEEASNGTYGVLLPIDIGDKLREIMLRFEPVLFDFEMNTDCVGLTAIR